MAAGDAFFSADDATCTPRPHARSPWAADMLHGRLLAGLAVREIERGHLGAGFRLARVTVDLFSVVPMAPVTLRSTLARDGRRVRAVDVVVACEGRDVARASALLVVTSGPPPGVVWGRPSWEVAPPTTTAGPRTAEADAMGTPDMRVIGRPLGTGGPHRAWLRELWPLVDGEAPTPLVRAVLAADVSNPLANWGDRGLQYINTDITVYLVRPPAGEWIGLEVTDHLDAGGLAIGQCRLHDERGPIGHAQVSGVSRAFGAAG